MVAKRRQLISAAVKHVFFCFFFKMMVCLSGAHFCIKNLHYHHHLLFLSAVDVKTQNNIDRKQSVKLFRILMLFYLPYKLPKLQYTNCKITFSRKSWVMYRGSTQV